MHKLRISLDQPPLLRVNDKEVTLRLRQGERGQEAEAFCLI